MGYRHYFYKCKKADIARIREKSLAELAEYAKEKGAELYLRDDSFLPQEEVFEFGKLYYEDTDEQIYGTGVLFFHMKRLWKSFRIMFHMRLGSRDF